MSNACLVTLLPRVQGSLQGSRKEGLAHATAASPLTHAGLARYNTIVILHSFVPAGKLGSFHIYCLARYETHQANIGEQRLDSDHKVSQHPVSLEKFA